MKISVKGATATNIESFLFILELENEYDGSSVFVFTAASMCLRYNHTATLKERALT